MSLEVSKLRLPDKTITLDRCSKTSDEKTSNSLRTLHRKFLKKMSNTNLSKYIMRVRFFGSVSKFCCTLITNDIVLRLDCGVWKIFKCANNTISTFLYLVFYGGTMNKLMEN